MAKPTRARAPIRPSVLDRLIQTGPSGSGLAASANSADSLTGLKASMSRDLGWLLNTRRTTLDLPADFSELRKSLLRYGCPDLQTMGGDITSVRRHLVREVEELIRLFEPRLSGVRVSLVEGGEEWSKMIRFVVEGTLRVGPDPQRVAFDTVLDVSSGSFRLDR